MPTTTHVHNLPPQKSTRRTLRNNLTPAEALLWRALQSRQLAGRKFRRQHGIGPYVVDFYCPAEKLVIELDGAGHFTVSGEAHDVARTAYLNGLGLRVLRFENRVVGQQMEFVLAAIEAAFGGDVQRLSGNDDPCKQRVPTTPSPSLAKEGN